jgi:hypothetical protein
MPCRKVAEVFQAQERLATLDSVKEWNRLTALYRDKNDQELEELGEAFQDLTEIAQQALRDELKARGMSDPDEIRQKRSAPDPALERSSEEEVPWILEESGDARLLGELQSLL